MSLFRLVLVVVIIYLGLLFSGYGVLIGSDKNAAGIGLQCKYLTARNIVTAQFINGENGIIGVSNCPLVKKLAITYLNNQTAGLLSIRRLLTHFRW